MERHAVIRFKRDVTFPRFGMKAGERWGFVVTPQRTEEWLRRIRAGDRFDFAGGQCLAQDVEIVYEGSDGPEYARACGYLDEALLAGKQVDAACKP